MRATVLAAALGLGFIVGAVAAQDKAPAGSPARGKALYLDLGCYACHGTHGQGGERGAGPKLYPNAFPWPAFLQHVRKPRLDMPAYVDRWVSDQDVADVYAYLGSLPAAPPANEIPLLKNF